MTLLRFFIATAIVLVASCASEDDGPKGTNGVNDVKRACEIRTTWVREGNECSLCEAGAISPRCDCTTLASFGAACIDQQNTLRQACGVEKDNCVAKCDRTDCGCIEACYADNAACKSAAAARDGCVAEVCGPHCK